MFFKSLLVQLQKGELLNPINVKLPLSAATKAFFCPTILSWTGDDLRLEYIVQVTRQDCDFRHFCHAELYFVYFVPRESILAFGITSQQENR